MTLLTPLGLLALITLPIIFLLHLRRERLRRVVVPSLLLWQHLPQDNGRQRKWLLPMTLLLLLHLTIAGLLALALSQPQWLTNLFRGRGTHIALVIDTSTSMQAEETTRTTRLDQARDQARQVLGSLGSNDRVSLIDAGPDATLLASGSSDNRAALLTVLDSISAGGTGTNLADALTLAQVATEQERGRSFRNNRIIVLSDLEPPAEASLPLERIEWRRVGNNIGNIALVNFTATPRRVGDSTTFDVFARIVNYDSNPYGLAVRLYGDGEPLGDPTPVSLQANGERVLAWDITTAAETLRAELNVDDILDSDNVAYLSLSRSRPAQVVLVSAQPDLLSRVLVSLPNVQVHTIAPDTYNSSPLAGSADITIFDNVLPAAFPAGGVLLVDPPPTGDTRAVLSVAEAPPPPDTLVPIIPPGADEMLEQVSLGNTRFGSPVRLDVPAWAEVQLVLRERSLLAGSQQASMPGDVPLIVRGQTGNSDIVIWTFDPDETSLPTRVAFPVLTGLTIGDLLPPAPPTSLLAGQPLTIQPHPRADTIELEAPDGQTRQVAISRTVLLDGLDQAGFYRLVQRANNDVLYAGVLAVNTGTARESNLAARAMPVNVAPFVAAEVPAVAQAAQQEHQEHALWPWLVLAALGVLVIEWLYVHFR